MAENRIKRDSLAGDRLFRNDGQRFNDVSETAGIFGGPMGYGLSVAVSDLDNNGCPDIYVSNDFHDNDYIYFNQCDTNCAAAHGGRSGPAFRSSYRPVADFL